MAGVRDGYHRQLSHSGGGPRVAGVKREIVGDGDGGDYCVVGACGWFAARSPQICGYPAEAAGCVSVEGQWFEIGFGLLDVCPAGGPFLVGRCHQLSH